MLTKEQIRYYRETYNCGNERVADADEGDACDCWLLRGICDQAILAISLQAELDRLKAERRWVPVGERLPEDGGKVLATTSSGNPFLAHYDHKWKCWRVSHTVKITHWQPLPELPKAGDNK